jgi:preprotein translocase subunit SecG
MTHMLALSLLQNLIVALFILFCVALILIILLQKGKGGGLGAAFGGGGAGSLLGTKTGDFLTWVTISLVAGFLVLAVLMGKFMRPTGSSSLSAPVAPPATPITAPITGAESTVVEDAEAGTPEAADETVDAVEETAAPEVEVVPEQADGTEADAETTE